MKTFVRNLSKRPFVRHTMTVAAGTAASQAITMAFVPLITRLYGPEAYGLQGIFMSVVSLLTAVAAFGYPIAIVLPKHDSDALGLARLSVAIGIATASTGAIVFLFFGPALLKLLNAEAISAFMYLIPVPMFIAVLTDVLNQWLIRKKAYVLTAKVNVLTTVVISSVKTGLGLVHPSALVLIATNMVGGLLGAALTYLGWRRLSAHQTAVTLPSQSSATLRELAIRHRDFPLLRTPQTLINAFSQSLPVLLLAGYFGAGTAGQYAIAISVLGMPAGLIGGSVMAVFYPRINEAIRNGENARRLIVKATGAMAVVGALPYLVVLAAGPYLFQLAFGEKWHTAGIYAQLLAGWLFLQFVNKPAVSAIPALRLQGGLLVYEFFSTGTKILALWLGFRIFKSDVAAVALFSAFGIAAYIFLILWVIRCSAKAVARSVGTQARIYDE